MCRPRSSPIEPIIVAESAATARPSMRTFQTLLAGKTGQAGAPGRLGAPALPPGGGVGVGVGVAAGLGVAAGVGVGVGVAMGVAASVGGWLAALRGSVRACRSAPSDQPSWSVSA